MSEATADPIRAVQTALECILRGVDREDGPYFRRALKRLYGLLGLSEGERRFVAALADDPLDFTTLEVFADYLEEQGSLEDRGRPEHVRFRKITPADGDVLIWSCCDRAENFSRAKKLAQEVQDRLRRIGRRTIAVIHATSYGLQPPNSPRAVPVKSGDLLVWEFDPGNFQNAEDTRMAARQTQANLEAIGKQTVYVLSPRGMGPDVRTEASLDGLVNILGSMTEEDRTAVLERFCRRCHTHIGDERDWSGSNYCESCSPDPRDD